jgi:hypothetical protein
MKKRNLVVGHLRESKPTVLITTTTLQAIRDDALNHHFSISKTIAELDELSNEINATLAFLKARRGDK